MIKVYGAPKICKSCRNFKNVIEKRKLIIEEIDIIENTANLKAFIQLREKSAAFEDARKNNKIGIPCFVKEDGEVTTDPDIALSWMGQEPVREEGILEPEEEECADCGDLLLHKRKQ